MDPAGWGSIVVTRDRTTGSWVSRGIRSAEEALVIYQALCTANSVSGCVRWRCSPRPWGRWRVGAALRPGESREADPWACRKLPAGRPSLTLARSPLYIAVPASHSLLYIHLSTQGTFRSMGKSLVIIGIPAKAKTINKYLELVRW